MATKTTTKTPTKTTLPTLPRVLAACQCGTNHLRTDDDGTLVFGQCDAKTSRTFAPGHDARLKGLLLRLSRAGYTYVLEDGGNRVELEPTTVLASRGWDKPAKPAKKAS